MRFLSELDRINRQFEWGKLEDLCVKYEDNPYVKRYAKILRSKSMSDVEKWVALEEQREKDFGTSAAYMAMMIYFGANALALALSLSVADPIVSRNWRSAAINGCVGIFLGVMGGSIGGLFGQYLYQGLGAGSDSMGKQIFARSVGWGVVGPFLAIAPGVVMRSWKRFIIGLAGGLIGGLLGGMLFDPIGLIVDIGTISRLVGLVAIGLFAAIGTGLIEKAAKTGWLKVVAGLIAGKQFILYRNPTMIGSSPQCDIYLFKDPQVAPRHAAIHAVSGGFEIEGAAPGTFVNGQAVSRSRLRSGDRIQIGSTVFEFQEKEKKLSAL